MKISLHNTLTREKEEFIPLDKKNVRMYFCGPTVYNYAHIGNGRAAVISGLMAEVLRFEYGVEHVQYVSNFTDIDDKIINAVKASEGAETMQSLTERFANIYNEDMQTIGVKIPDIQPRATQYVPQMLDMIAKLIKKGHAYAEQGHVLFDTSSYADYGRLSNRNMDDMIAGARVEVAPYKKNPADFVLWKPSTEDQPGWDSPYGRGRPGWHLECSVMNEVINGNHFDIHSGGADIVFPHHENEVAQSTCAHDGEKYVNYWLHVGMLTVDDVKMSKSLNNFFTVHELIEKYPGEAIRLALLSAHYRQPLNWSHELVMQSKKTLDKYYSLLLNFKDVQVEDVNPPQSFLDAIGDDLNTPKALAELSALGKMLSMASSEESKVGAKSKLIASAKLLGLLQGNAEEWLKNSSEDEKRIIEEKIAEMQKARADKDYETADKIKTELKENFSVIVSINTNGVDWRRE